MAMLSVNNLQVHYGMIQAIKDLPCAGETQVVLYED